MIETVLVIVLVLIFAMAAFLMGYSVYYDFFKDRKPTTEPNWVWQDISLFIDDRYRNCRILINRDNGFVVAKIIGRNSGVSEAYYKGQLVGEYLDTLGGIATAEQHINDRMNLNKLGVK